MTSGHAHIRVNPSQGVTQGVDFRQADLVDKKLLPIQVGWFDDVKVVYFGPSERLVVEDPIISDQAQEIAEAGGSFACKYISDRDGVSEKIGKLGVQVEYVGSIISDLIKDGYTPMVW